MSTFRAVDAWGSRSQISATLADVRDTRGVARSTPKAGIAGVIALQPLLNKAASFIAAGLGTRDEMQELMSFRAAREAAWGMPVTTVPARELKHAELFAVQKAAALTRLGRTPREVTDSFVPASGNVMSHVIADRRIFVQRFRPIGASSGKVFVVSPGYQETGRNFYEQVELLNRAGHDALVMDHQWAGQSSGRPGAIDRGFGVARDVAVVAAEAQRVAQAEYGARGAVCLLGNSMGAGAGVFLALMLAACDARAFGAVSFPVIEAAVLESPFFGLTPGPITSLIDLLAGVKGLNQLAAPSSGLPSLIEGDDQASRLTKQRTSQTVVLEDVRTRMSAMHAAAEDLAIGLELLEEGVRPRARLAIVHATRDPLADPELTAHVAKQLGVLPLWIDGAIHVTEQHPELNKRAIEAAARLLGDPRR